MNTSSVVGGIGDGLSMLAHPVQVSFEFSPPGDDKMEQTLWQSIQRLAPLRPRFVSVTYGADGSTRERTHNLVTRVGSETLLTPAAHLTCVGMDREHVLEIARSYWHTGVRHIVALRGDAPQGSSGYQPHPGGFAYAVDLGRGHRHQAQPGAGYPADHALSAHAALRRALRRLGTGLAAAALQRSRRRPRYAAHDRRGSGDRAGGGALARGRR